MGETDLQVGGGYTYQWDCATLLALNYFFEPVCYDSTLFDLVHDFLGPVTEIHLEGEDRESGLDLEDINLVSGDRRILIQVKTKQAEGERWTLTDELFLKALCRFYGCRSFTKQPEKIRFVFLTNRPFNPDLARVKAAIGEDAVDQCPEADKLCRYLERYLQEERKKKSIDVDRFREVLRRTRLVMYLPVDAVKANVQAKLQARGRHDWNEAQDKLFEYFARESTRLGGGTVTRASVVEVLKPPRDVQPQPDPTSFAGKTLGRYQVKEELGRGVMSVVYRAFDPKLDRDVALKLLWPELSADRESKGRLECQGQTQARLRHPHIVTVHDFGEVDGQFYIAMECLSGRTLALILDAERALPWDLALLILDQLADALDYAHRHDVLHRNVKPSNISVEQEAGEPLRAVLTDFGLLKDWKLRDTDTVHIWGTPRYMAYEVIDKGDTGAAADLYALAVVAYEMLTGSVPYGGSISDIVLGHKSEELPDVSSLRPDLSSDVDDVFRKALAKDPAARFDTGVEFVSALKAAVA